MTDRERFVPRGVADIARRLESVPFAGGHSHRDHDRDSDSDSDSDDDADGGDGDGNDAGRWSSFFRLVAALYHFEFHAVEQRTSEAWDNIGDDPDAAASITGDLTGLLDGANYTPISQSELDRAMQEEALIPLRLEVDFDLYDELLIYRRGSHIETVEQKRFLRKPEQLEITVDDDVVVHSRIKPSDWFTQHDIDPAERGITPGDVSLKQFRNVPRADIEMLLPATEVRFRLIDTLKIAVPGVISAIVVLATKLLPTLGLLFVLVGFYVGFRDEQPDIDQARLLVLFGGLAALGGFVFRQWNKLKNRKIEYLKTLSENLYFRTVADGPGVFHILLSSAEQQEVIEVLIAYRMLLATVDPPTADELDRAAEDWLAGSCEADVDFEVDDALAKLSRLGIAAADRHERWCPVELAEALTRLDRRWDDLFRFDTTGDGTSTQLSTTTAGPDDEPGDEAEPGDAPPLLRLRRVVDRFRSRLGERIMDTS